MRTTYQDRTPTKIFPLPSLAGLALLLLAGLAISAGPARAETVEFQATLDQDQAVPAPTAVPDAGGRAYVTLETDSNEIAWEIEYYSLSGDIVAIHFHGPAKPGETGDIAVAIDNTSEMAGKLTGSAQITAEQAQQLMDGLWYVNIHTALNPAGEIRGQLVKQ
jgi:hypothetical protein